jgi:energy-coupling factor transporter ATP-binding protein EcfA2
VLDAVDLALRERDVLCVIGPSGSGKTTLLRCMALLTEPSAGSVLMRDQVVATPGPDRTMQRAARGVRAARSHPRTWRFPFLGGCLHAPLATDAGDVFLDGCPLARWVVVMDLHRSPALVSPGATHGHFC